MVNEAPLLAIVGPTASGKTVRAVHTALRLGGEIIGADSRQVYRDMDLGTGKDLADYTVTATDGTAHAVPYHLIDIRPAGYRYNLHEYLADFEAAESDIRRRGRLPIVCGGTGMYVEAALSGIRLPEVPENRELRESLRDRSHEELTAMLAGMKRLHNTTDTDTRARAIRAIEIQTYYAAHPGEAERADRRSATPRPHVLIGLAIEREERRRRIAERLERRLAEGMTGEVERLLAAGVRPESLIYYGLEYKYVTEHVTGLVTAGEMHRGLLTAIQQFAKRQMTWLRGMERRGFRIHWLPAELPPEEFAERGAEIYHEHTSGPRTSPSA